MRRTGMSEDEIYAALVVMLDRCEPGHTHTEKDCRRIARSIAKKPAADSPGCLDDDPGPEPRPQWQDADVPEAAQVRPAGSPQVRPDLSSPVRPTPYGGGECEQVRPAARPGGFLMAPD